MNRMATFRTGILSARRAATAIVLCAVALSFAASRADAQCANVRRIVGRDTVTYQHVSRERGRLDVVGVERFQFGSIINQESLATRPTVSRDLDAMRSTVGVERFDPSRIVAAERAAGQPAVGVEWARPRPVVGRDRHHPSRVGVERFAPNRVVSSELCY